MINVIHYPLSAIRKYKSTVRQRSTVAGFTLIELLVVISIIGILATLIIANFNDARSRARDTKRKQELRALKQALQLYYNDHQLYPANSTDNKIMCNGSSCTNSFTINTTTYMTSLPNEYSYTQTNSGDSYILKVTLENASDPDLATSQARCPGNTYAPTEYVLCPD